MNFQPHLAELVLRGEKTVTRRLISANPRSPWYSLKCGITPGRDYAVCPGRGKHAIGRIRVLSVERMPLGHLSDDEARREGFPDAAAFETAFTAINGHYNPYATVWRVAFEVTR